MDSPQRIFTIMPMGQDFSLTPGESVRGLIYVINPQDSAEDFDYKVHIAPYGVTGDDYDVDIVTETAETMIKDWIVIDNPTGTVSPGETHEITFTINTPENAPGGGQYSAIVVEADDKSGPSEGTVAVDFSYQMASIVYADVAGETVHSGALTSHYLPNFSTTPHVSLTATFENNGNVHEVAKITLFVTDFFTGEDYFSSDESESDLSEVVMPSTTRRLVRDLSNLPSLGVITVKETIEYMGETSNLEEHVLICPLWFLVLVVTTLFSLIGAIVSRVIHSHKKQKTLPKEDFEIKSV